MTTKESFYHFLKNNSSQNINNFIITFDDQIEILPKKITSSKKIIQLLEIQNIIEFEIFKKAFSEYYRHIIL